MNGMARLKAGESLGKLVWPDVEDVISTTPKGDLDTILSTAKFAAENAIKNRYMLAPWLDDAIINRYDITYEPKPHYIVSHVRIEATRCPGVIAILANIVSLTTLLDMFKSVTKNVYISDIIMSGENYNIKEISVLSLPEEGVYIEAKEGDTFPLTINAEVPGAIGLQSVIVKEYDMLLIGDLWLEIVPDPIGMHMAKALNNASGTITDHAFLIRGIRK
ncbi:hypothetical protein GM182_05065 [bacterium 3DAC]|jgi:molybdenum cofactor biosynthesis enzyme|nr:hypothetical protein [Dictyoglomota bacterium]UZN23252.1 hypothetical protein GM182_05065 [bacterium 3DAC]